MKHFRYEGFIQIKRAVAIPQNTCGKNRDDNIRQKNSHTATRCIA